MSQPTIVLDVRDDIRIGREPFSRIMTAVASLRPEERLLLIVPFEPIPLFGVMEKRGFQHHAQPTASGDWEVLFTPQSAPASIEPASMGLPETAGADARRGNPSSNYSAGREIAELDARGLEPPEPMIRILEKLSAMPEEAELKARTDRRPMHLYAQLAQRGFTAETEEQSDGTFITHIHRG